MEINDKQAGLLKRAAEADDGMIDAADVAKVHAAVLLRFGLVMAIPVDGGGKRFLITEVGRTAIGLPPASKEEPPAPPAPPALPDVKGKLGKVVELLAQPGGATIEAMMSATGWQSHSVRGAISGSIKKKLKRAVISEKTEAGRIYRLNQGAGA